MSPKVSSGEKFHMPAALLAKIVSLVGVDGVDALKNWIKAGPEGKAAVFSKETLSTVRLDKSQQVCLPTSLFSASVLRKRTPTLCLRK